MLEKRSARRTRQWLRGLEQKLLQVLHQSPLLRVIDEGAELESVNLVLPPILVVVVVVVVVTEAEAEV